MVDNAMEENNLIPMNRAPKQKTLFRSLLEVMLLVLTVIAAFQYANYLIFPEMTILYSHIIGITFGVMVIGATAYRVQKRQEQLSLGKMAETEKRMQIEASLLDVAEKYHNLFIDSMDGVCQTTLDGKIVEANRAFCDILGCNVEGIIGESITQFYDNLEDRVKFRNIIEKNKGIKNYEIIQKRKDGQKIICSISSSCYYLKNGELSGYLSIVRDITDSKLQEAYKEMGMEILQILNESRELPDAIQLVLGILKERTGFDAVGIRLQDGDDFPYFAQDGFPDDFLLTENSLIERAADGGVCRSEDGNVRLECTCGLVISGKLDSASPLFTPGGSFWINDSFPLLDLPSDQDPRLHPRNQCIHEGYASVALVPIRNKEMIVGLLHFNDRRKGRFTLQTIELLEGIASHIGEAIMRKRMEEEILSLSITDQLTGLHNRRGFLSLAEQQIKLSTRNQAGMLLFFADLDGLKWINDTLGHEEGDKALVEAATVLKETFRASDIIARLGGDEYAALAVDITTQNYMVFTNRLQSLIDICNNQENRRYTLSISVGCSRYDSENPCSIEELMVSADKLMYEQKQNKKNRLPQGATA
jgi:diguanylate cyclase (GGDEF)-like protein/PAS domain S-box-containing protein